MAWKNPLEQEYLCDSCADENRIEVCTDGSGCYPIPDVWQDCEDCPVCRDCSVFVSQFDRKLIHYDEDDAFFLCGDCAPKEPSELDRAADLTRGMIALMRTNY